MTLLFCDGFDHYGNADTAYKWDDSPGLSHVLAAASARFPATNKQGLEKQYSSDTYWSKKNIPDRGTVFLGFAFYIDLLSTPTSTTTSTLIRFLDSGTRQVHFRVNPDYTISALNGSGTVLGTSSSPLTTSTWNYIEIKVVIHATAGEAVLKVNEVEWLNLTNQVTQITGNATVNAVTLSAIHSNIDVWYDDLYICDSLGTENNDFLGDITIETLRPTAAGTYTQWTPSTGSNWQNVDDPILIDEDTTYNSSVTVGQKDSFTLADLVATSGVTIKGISISSTVRKDDPGARSVKPLIRTNSTDYQLTEVPLTDGYTGDQQIAELNPNTGVAWTIADINALESGIEVIS